MKESTKGQCTLFCQIVFSYFLLFIALVLDAAIAFALLFSAQVCASVFVFAGLAHLIVSGQPRWAHQSGGTGPAGSLEMQ